MTAVLHRDPAETIAAARGALRLRALAPSPPRRRRRSAPRRRARDTTPALRPRARRSPSTNRASSTVTAEYSEPATATSDSSPWLVATANSELAATSQTPIATSGGHMSRGIRIEGRTKAARDEQGRDAARPRGDDRPCGLGPGAQVEEPEEDARSRAPRAPRGRPTPGPRPATRDRARARRATTPTIASHRADGLDRRRPLALDEPRDDRDEHAQGADRRHDAHRAERHRPVEGAERDHDAAPAPAAIAASRAAERDRRRRSARRPGPAPGPPAG